MAKAGRSSILGRKAARLVTFDARASGGPIPSKRLQLIHWNRSEARELAQRLRSLGYRVRNAIPEDAAALRALGASPPDGVVIDLTRLPAQGRDVGVFLRQAAATRHVPLIFVGGGREKVAGTRKLLPDATFTSWVRIESALQRALTRPIRDPARPGSVMAGYSGTPLPRKLGIKPGSTVTLLSGPADFAKTLGSLPEGARLTTRLGAGTSLVIWFVGSRRDLERGIARQAAAVPRDGMWIAWPKKSSGVATDVSEGDVRATGLANGLVDYKICAIDAIWSGLKFAVRKREA